MGQNFVGCDREQELLLPPSLREWLPEGHLAWFVIDAVAAMSLDAFYASYRADGHGRAALDPSMMLTLLLYAYSTGQRSSRAIERRCSDDVAFRVITANQTPDHATIARFRVRHQQALGELFGEVLALCAKAGLVSVGVIALDGTKLRANASDRVNREYQRIAEEILAEADELDAQEDARFGERRGDELPAELSNSNDRRQRLRDARHALEAERAARQRPVPGDRRGRLLMARDRLEEDHALETRVIEEHNVGRATGVASDGSRRMSRAPGQLDPPPAPTGQANTTDPDSRKVKATRGYLQGYNAQAVTTEQQIVIAAELTIETDVAQLAPMIDHARRELTGSGIQEQPGTVLADAGYWNAAHIEKLTAEGCQVLVPPDALKAGKPRPGRVGGLYTAMREALSTDTGAGLYSQRQWMVEPVFADIKFNRRADRFQRRGRAACRSEWRLITATHNLLKLSRHSTPILA